MPKRFEKSIYVCLKLPLFCYKKLAKLPLFCYKILPKLPLFCYKVLIQNEAKSFIINKKGDF
jgi:hypothetical protein